MCGIVGTSDRVGPILLEAARLEYRGYDSAGIALVTEGRPRRVAAGKLANLRPRSDPPHAGSGSRTPGGPPTGARTLNAHPRGLHGDITVVHNII
jgi:glucosamine--fructose-6-phosphate aminotransferase (isomerizing)